MNKKKKVIFRNRKYQLPDQVGRYLGVLNSVVIAQTGIVIY